MSVSLCPNCQSPLSAGAPVCTRCGTPLNAGLSTRPRVVVRVVRADGGPEVAAEMRSDVMTCGRRAELTLPDDPFVADQQARFFFSGNRLAIEDIGGANGVFARLRYERELPAGGEMRLGRQRLLAEAIPSLAHAPDGTTAWGSPDAGCRFRLIQLFEGGIRGSAYPIREGETLIAREAGDIAFPQDGFVSSRHAQLRAQGDKLTVKDLGSSNGTFLRLFAPAFVENSDQFLVGRQLLRVEIG